MRNSILVILIGFLIHNNLYNAEPVIEVPELPPSAILEYYEDSEELFFAKLMEYYDIAVALRSQIIILGYEPETKLHPPSIETITDQDIQIIKRYWKIAKSLETELLLLPDDYLNKQIEELRQKVITERRKYDSLSFNEMEEGLENRYNNFFEAKLNDCIKKNSEKDFLIDSIKHSCYLKVEEQRELVSEYYKNYNQNSIRVLSASVSGSNFLFSDERIQTNLSAGAAVTFNCNPIFAFGKYFDIWAEYFAPVISTEIRANSGIKQSWSSDLYSVGVSGIIPKIIEISDLFIDLKLGVGHFWGNSNLTNIGANSPKFIGQKLRFELNFRTPSIYSPLEIFFAYSTYFSTNDIIFGNQANAIDLGKTNFSSFSLGARIILSRSVIFENN